MITFEDLGYKPEILKALTDLGFQTPTPIQEKTAQVLIETDQDLVGLAQTGTGKTAAFGLPIIHDIEVEDHYIHALILTPTRELCMQVCRDLESYAKHIKGVDILAVYGGTDIKTQINRLKRQPHVLVATPGRLIDLMNRGKVHLDQLEILVLDEADEMLNMGFKDDIETILQKTPDNRRTLMFSATMPRDVHAIAQKYLYNPQEVTIGNKNESTANVTHHFYLAQSSNRYNTLRRIVDAHPDIYGMVFCRTRAETKDVAEKLVNHGYNADALHGDLSQSQRDFVMDKFRRKSLQVLVATDVAARGIDVDNLTHVINYNLPDDVENYTHRSGRTGRAGKEGISIAIIHSREFGRLREIERIIKKKFEQQMIPSGLEICQSQLMHYFDKLVSIELNEGTIAEFIPAAIEKLGGLDKEELIKRIVAHEFQHLLHDYKNAPDLNIPAPKKERREREFRSDGRRDRDRGGRDGGRERGRDGRRDRDERAPRPRESRRDSDGNWESMTIDMGANHDINPSQVIAIINKALGNRNSSIGRIKINPSDAVFEVKLMESVALLEKKTVKFDGKDVKFFKS